MLGSDALELVEEEFVMVCPEIPTYMELKFGVVCMQVDMCAAVVLTT
jgi:hypothetical protein